MRLRSCKSLIRNVAVASLLWTASRSAAFATSAEPAKDPQIDPAPCIAAAAADDADKTIAVAAR